VRWWRQRGEKGIEGSVWQKKTREDSKEMGGREIRGLGRQKRERRAGDARSCGEWQREIEGSGGAKIEIAGHKGKEKEICRRVGGIKENKLTLKGRGVSRGEWYRREDCRNGRRKRRLRGVGDGREDCGEWYRREDCGSGRRKRR
jgi:hypothetical protein